MASNGTDLFHRIDFSNAADPRYGQVRWSAAKSVWWTGMLLIWLIVGIIYFSWSAVFVFLGSCAVTLCLGHSIGMHRKLIHESFDCPNWLEAIFIYLGTLVGLGGPMTMMHMHDMRDWAQRQSACHGFLSHQQVILKDFWWQIHCKLHLENPPDYRHPARVSNNGFYQFLQRTSALQQLPIAIIFYLVGGWGWVAWGVCGRVTVSIFGHWIIGYFAHNSGQRDWRIIGAAVQGYNVRYFGWITFGECWHNNHHAFPESARLGLYAGQFDPGWVVLKALKKLGLITRLDQPEDLPDRPELARIRDQV